MVKLEALQKDFLKSFQGIDLFEDYIKIKGASPQNRLFVYQNNIREALRKALTLTYPLTWKLIGENCANGAAYAFIKEGSFLPKAATLDEWGADFPTFLKQFASTKSLAYLSDFAKLEWLKHLSAMAESIPFLTAFNFLEMDPIKAASLILKLHPSAYLFSSSYPIDQVMAVVEEKIESVKLENRHSKAIVIRSEHTANIHWISNEYYLFFSGILKGDSLLKIIQKNQKIAKQFHEILSFSLQNGIFSEYTFTSP